MNADVHYALATQEPLTRLTQAIRAASANLEKLSYDVIAHLVALTGGDEAILIGALDLTKKVKTLRVEKHDRHLPACFEVEGASVLLKARSCSEHPGKLMVMRKERHRNLLYGGRRGRSRRRTRLPGRIDAHKITSCVCCVSQCEHMLAAMLCNDPTEVKIPYGPFLERVAYGPDRLNMPIVSRHSAKSSQASSVASLTASATAEGGTVRPDRAPQNGQQRKRRRL